MAPPVNKLGHPPDVTVLIFTKETDVRDAQRDSREMVARNVLLVSREPSVKNVQRTTTEIIVVMIFLYQNLCN